MRISARAVAIVSYLSLFVCSTNAFVPRAGQTSLVRTPLSTSPAIRQQSVALNMLPFDPVMAADAFTTFTDSVLSSPMLLSFTDQGQNLAGTFFQASLLPYLIFLYFLSFRANRLPATANFGFQFVLLFVLSTIPSGIVTKSVYGLSLANVDWLHGAAESLLTVANVLIVLGLNECLKPPNPKEPPVDVNQGRVAAFGVAGLFLATIILGTQLHIDPHLPFLFGLGDLPATWAQQLPFVTHNEPINALSIPTWAIHFSSVIEYWFAMSLIWKLPDVTKTTQAWKGLTWGMLPLHASGICACTYHFFYNPSTLQFLVSMQAGFTLLGNITCAIAAYRIARANGWSIQQEFLPRSSTSPEGLVADGIAAMPLEAVVVEDKVDSNKALALKLIGLTLGLSYLVKYGELGLDIPFEPNPALALAMVIGIPAVTGFLYYSKSEGKGLPSFGNSSLSMADVKKYGVAGTVAYVLTELAFWIIAFPAAAYALYQSTGHWPDVINDNGDRAAVLAFIFAGANVARAFVPVRLGAALALAPWVDENILGGKNDEEGVIDVESSSSSRR